MTTKKKCTYHSAVRKMTPISIPRSKTRCPTAQQQKLRSNQSNTTSAAHTYANIYCADVRTAGTKHTSPTPVET